MIKVFALSAWLVLLGTVPALQAYDATPDPRMTTPGSTPVKKRAGSARDKWIGTQLGQKSRSPEVEDLRARQRREAYKSGRAEDSSAGD